MVSLADWFIIPKAVDAEFYCCSICHGSGVGYVDYMLLPLDVVMGTPKNCSSPTHHARDLAL